LRPPVAHGLTFSRSDSLAAAITFCQWGKAGILYEGNIVVGW